VVPLGGVQLIDSLEGSHVSNRVNSDWDATLRVVARMLGQGQDGRNYAL
jgi:hypothetical protein